MDLTGIISPVLNFAYANDKWAGDFDHLTVYYRVAPEQPWVVIERYDRTYAAR